MTRMMRGLALLLAASASALAQEGYVRGAFTSRGGDDASSMLQKYQVIPDGDVSLAADVAFRLEADRYLALFVDKLFDGDERARVEFGNRRGFRVGVFYDRLPNWFSNTARTAFRATGTGDYLVDDALQAAIQAPEATAQLFEDAAVPIDLRTWREAIGADLELPFGGGAFVLAASYRNETRSGSQPIDVALFRTQGPPANPAPEDPPDQRIFEIPATTEDTTRDARLGLEFVRGRLHLAAAALVSAYDNDIARHLIENPTRIDPIFQGPTTLLASTWNDNEAVFVDLSGSYALGRDHRLSFALARGRLEQDEPFLPYTLNPPEVSANPAVPDPALVPPYSSIDARIDTTLYTARLTGNPGRFGYELSWRTYELENDTPVYTFVNTPRMDTFAEEGPFHNEPADWSKDRLRAEGHYDVADWVRLGARYELENWDRPQRRVTENKVQELRVTADLRFSPRISARLMWAEERQDEEALGEPAEGERPDARQYDIAERDTTRIEAHAMFALSEKAHVGISGARADNTFPGSRFGATRMDYKNWGADLSYEFNENATLFLAVLNERFEADQRSRYSNPTSPTDADNPLNDWRSETRDDTLTYQVGLEVRASERFELSLDLMRSEGFSNQACIPVPGGSLSGECAFPTAGPNVVIYPGWPEVESVFHWFKARGRYAFSRRLALGLEFWDFRWSEEDWALDPMDVYVGDTLNPANQYGLTKSTFLGARVPGYNADIYRVYLDYTF